MTLEGTMTEFADIFAYELPTTVYLAGSVAMLMAGRSQCSGRMSYQAWSAPLLLQGLSA